MMVKGEHLPVLNYNSSAEGDKLRGKCGVFAVLSPEGNAGQYIFLGLEALQHRGQEAAGVTVNADYGLVTVKDEGLVTEVLGQNGDRITMFLEAEEGIGHVRYGTSSADNSFDAAQPLTPNNSGVSIAENGDIVNKFELAEEYGIDSIGKTNSQIEAEIIASLKRQEVSLEETLLQMLPKLKGAFSIVIVERMLNGEGRIIAARDEHAIRPLSVGRLENGGWAVASETTALDIVGAAQDREIPPGTFEVFDNNGVTSYFWSEKDKQTIEEDLRRCAIEFVYKASPDSNIGGRNVYMSRARAGEILAHEHPVDADIVIGVPDSGRAAAYGYAKAMNLDNPEGLFKRRYTAGNRTYIMPTQEERKKALKLKFNPIPAVVKDQRLIVVDDSIIRGNTMRQLVGELKDAGALEVHLRIASPMNKYSCYYGMDTGDPSQLIANNMDLDEMTAYLNADSIAFLSVEGLREAVAPKIGDICTACMTGIYPVPIEGYKETAVFAGHH
jgi:amidophosphoribosyltransferase